MSSVKLHITAELWPSGQQFYCYEIWVNRTYSRWKIKLIYYIKTINYYNSDYKIEMYAKNYGYKVRSNNYSMCHWQKIKSFMTIIVVLLYLLNQINLNML